MPRYPKKWDDKYTEPELRLRLKDEVVAGDKGGQPGQWSARKAQLLAARYEKEGGGYLGKRDETQQHLVTWTEEDWRTSDDSDEAQRYLPKAAWDELSEREKAETNARKAEGTAHGEQFVANPEAAKEAAKHAREHS